MNNKRFIFAAAAVVFAACAQLEENPTETQVPVSLKYSTVDAVESKAAQNLNEGTFASGESVLVRVSNTGAGSWTDYTFTTGDAGAMTAPNPGPYYPAGSQNIDIVAYYPATAGTSFTVATDQTADASYKASDLMFASVSDQAKQAAAVNLAFTHKMAKLNVNITPGQGVSSINSLSVLNVKPTVSFDQATGAVGSASGDATTIAMSNNGSAIIPAQTIDGGLLSIVTDQGTATYSVADKAFAAGQLYTINITVNLRAVGTTTAITGWTSEGTVNVTPGDWTVDVSGTYTYNGSAIVPDAANITVHSTSANADIDAANYNVYTDNNINAGEATLIVSGKGAYAGNVAYCTYTINKAAGSISYGTSTVGKFTVASNFVNSLTFTGDGTMSYTSSNESVATVNNSTGEVDILAAGETTITATVGAGTNYTYATSTASYTLSVEAAPASLSALKSKVGSFDCTSIVGYEVYDDGNIAPKGTNSGTVIGYVAYVKTDGDADVFLVGSRILVIASEDASTGQIHWSSAEFKPGHSDKNAWDGYNNTKSLVEDANHNNIAATTAWNYQSKAGAAVVTGSTGWFLPSLRQLWTLANLGIGHGKGSILQTNTGMQRGYKYWSSTDDGYGMSWLIYLDNVVDTGVSSDDEEAWTDTGYAAVRACFAF